jgi:hypothetical protein
MTPKEEAIELVQEFYDNVNFSECYQGSMESAKQCALICVNRSIESLYRVVHSFCSYEIEHLKEVKQEINKL